MTDRDRWLRASAEWIATVATHAPLGCPERWRELKRIERDDD